MPYCIGENLSEPFELAKTNIVGLKIFSGIFTVFIRIFKECLFLFNIILLNIKKGFTNQKEL
jgi:hypothetical protein